ncbi:MAG TPA: hypothetical protein VK616_07760, partial [Flavitalea sp.]|nr:hypothetical protein [Flavitalea sp.]
NEHSNVSLEKTDVNVDSLVRVVNGPLMNHEGRVIAVKSKTVKIVLPSLGFIMSAEVETGRIEIIRDSGVYYERRSNTKMV